MQYSLHLRDAMHACCMLNMPSHSCSEVSGDGASKELLHRNAVRMPRGSYALHIQQMSLLLNPSMADTSPGPNCGAAILAHSPTLPASTMPPGPPGFLQHGIGPVQSSPSSPADVSLAKSYTASMQSCTGKCRQYGRGRLDRASKKGVNLRPSRASRREESMLMSGGEATPLLTLAEGAETMASGEYPQACATFCAMSTRLRRSGPPMLNTLRACRPG